MTRLILWTLLFALLLIFGGVLAQLMQQDAGVMMITWNGWMLETTFWSGIAMLIMGGLMLMFVIVVWRKIAPTNLLCN